MRERLNEREIAQIGDVLEALPNYLLRLISLAPEIVVELARNELLARQVRRVRAT